MVSRVSRPAQRALGEDLHLLRGRPCTAIVTVCCPLPSVVNLSCPGGEVNSGLISMLKVTVEVEGVWTL